MCNNNGACRKLEGGVMCPSYRATRNEKDVTRGRANTLRLAISGQLGPDALASDEMMDTLKLCVSCKACRHECPTGVDMAKMKIEVLAARAAKHGLSLRDRLVGYLPRYADLASRFAPLANWRNNSPLLRALFEKFAGISAKRALPAFRRDVFKADAEVFGPADGHEVVLFADTFNRTYERENLDAALRVLVEGGYRVHMPRPVDRARPLCCGRTFLSAGLVEQARSELDRLVATYAPFAARGVPIVGLEPSCLLTLRDELLSLRSDNDAKSDQRARIAVRGISGSRGGSRPPETAARRHAGEGAGSWPLPSKIVRRIQAGREGAAPRSRTSRSRPSSPVAAAWPAPSAMAPTPIRPRWKWPNCRCCRRCAAPMRPR